MTRVQQYMAMHLTQQPLRACQLCAHGCTSGGKQCSNPDFVHEPSKDTSALRAFGGACGVEAKYLAMPGVTC